MTFSIGSKIFGIALGLLTLMMVVAFYSSWLVGRVQAEVETIAEHYIPITNTVADLDVSVLEQEIHLEHLKNLYLYDPENSSEIERLRDAFNERGERVDQRTAEALERVRAGLDSEIEALDKVEFARLEAMIEAIEREHQDFNDLSLRLLEALEQDNREVFSSLSELIVLEEEEYDQRVSRIR